MVSVFTRSHTTNTGGLNWKLQKKQSQSDILLYFFSQRCISRWNSLCQEAVDSPSVNVFKNHLEKSRRRQMDWYILRNAEFRARIICGNFDAEGSTNYTLLSPKFGRVSHNRKKSTNFEFK